VRTLTNILDQVLVDSPELTRRKLEELRDSGDASDRRAFWSLASKRIATQVELDTKQGGTLEQLIMLAIAQGQAQLQHPVPLELREGCGEGALADGAPPA
jgi:hypothetical protein